MNNQSKASILADLWRTYRNHEGFQEFIEYNDIGLPLAYCLDEGLVIDLSDDGWAYVNETFLMFVSGLGFDESEIEDGTSLNSLLEIAATRDS